MPRSSNAYTRWSNGDIDGEALDVDIEYKDSDVDDIRHNPFDVEIEGKSLRKSNRAIIITALVVSMLFALGLMLAYFLGHDNSPNQPTDAERMFSKLLQDYEKTWSDVYQSQISAENIGNNIRYLSEKPRYSGSAWSNETAVFVQKAWQDLGFDSVVKKQYQVLLSYPNMHKSSTVKIVQDLNVIFEAVLSDSNDTSMLYNAYNAFSKSDNELGNVIYVNYGRVEDFEELKKNYISPIGCLVVARYGKIYRGNAVENAYKYKAKGVVFYPDPADFGYGGSTEPYPHSRYLPDYAIVRGNVKLGYGDIRTPGYPSIKNVLELLDASESLLPKLPVVSISGRDAKEIMKLLDGEEVPAAWQGKMNMTYRFGGQFQDTRNKLTIDVSTSEEVKTIYNVIGTVRGAVEPDRYVIIGSHRDSWTFGAMDGASGMACQMEIAHGIGALLEQGWRPRRTILFANWGGEEQGMMGSTEWVEEYLKTLSATAVAYINIDMCVDGTDTLEVGANPTLKDVVFEGAKSVPLPDQPDVSVYDKWLGYWNMITNDHVKEPIVEMYGSGSDFAAFNDEAGVPYIHIGYTQYLDNPVSVYHTGIDTYDYLHRFVDPHFQYHATVSKVAGDILLRLSDSALLPISPEQYINLLKTYIEQQPWATLVDDYNIDLDVVQALLLSSLNYYEKAVSDFKANMLDKDELVLNPLLLRSVNDKLMLLERQFITCRQNTTYPQMEHVLFGPGANNDYGVTPMRNLLLSIVNFGNDIDDWGIAEIAKQINIVGLAIKSAADLLCDGLTAV